MSVHESMEQKAPRVRQALTSLALLLLLPCLELMISGGYLWAR